MWKTDLMVGGDLLLNVRATESDSFVFHAVTDSSGFGGSDIFLAKLDSLGNIVWANYLGTALNETPRSLAVDAQGNIFVSYSQASGTSSSISYLIKMSPDGKILWTRSYNATGATNFVLGYIVTDGVRVYAQGYVQTSGFQGAVLALSATNGDIIWNVVGPATTAAGVYLASETTVRLQYIDGTVVHLLRDTGALSGTAYKFAQQSAAAHEPKAALTYGTSFVVVALQTSGTTATRGVYISMVAANGALIPLGSYSIATNAAHTFKWAFIIGTTLYIGFTEGTGSYQLVNCTILAISLTSLAMKWAKRTNNYMLEAGEASGQSMVFMSRDRAGNVSTVRYESEADLLADTSIVDATNVNYKTDAMLRNTVGFGINARAYVSGSPAALGSKPHGLNPKPPVLQRMGGWISGG